MKRIFTILFVAVLATQLDAQIIFKQDFESGMAPMKVVDLSGRTPHPNVGVYTQAWNVVNPAFGNGTNVAVSNSWFNPPGRADGWMMTPAIAVESESTVVQWSARAVDANFPDGYEVRVSITGDEPGDFTDVIFSTAAEQPTWNVRTASLANYVGQEIHIAWRNNSNDMFLLAVDDIEVKALRENYADFTGLGTTRYHEVNAPVLIVGTIENIGSNAITSLEITWTQGESTHTDVLSDINIAVGTTYTFEHSVPFIPAAATSYEIEVLVSNPNGEEGDVEGAERRLIVSGLSGVPMKRVVVEEGTGTWCGWCPRGFVAMEAMIDDHPDTWIGIMVHNQDPMTISAYDQASAFPGFPSAHVDRVLRGQGVSLPAFQSYHELGTLRVVPAGVEGKASYKTGERLVTIEASAEFFTEMPGSDFRFSVVMVEDSVRGSGNTWNQANFYSFQSQNIPLVGHGLNWQQEPNPVPAARMHYNETARALIGGYNGTPGVIPADIADGLVASQEFEYNAPAAVNLNNMRAVILLIDGQTGHIVNAIQVPVEEEVQVSTREDVVKHNLSVFPNPASAMVNLDLELEQAAEVQLSIFNALGQKVDFRNLGMINGQMNIPVTTPNNVPGVYSFVLHINGQTVTRQVIFR